MAIARLVCERTGLKFVAGIDINLALVGKNPDEILGTDRTIGATVFRPLQEANQKDSVDVVMRSPQSLCGQFRAWVLEILGEDLEVVSTSEEMSLPWLKNV